MVRLATRILIAPGCFLRLLHRGAQDPLVQELGRMRNNDDHEGPVRLSVPRPPVGLPTFHRLTKTRQP